MSQLRAIPKPEPGEYVPYVSMYIDLLPNDGMVLEHLWDNVRKVGALITQFTESQLTTPHAKGEWTIKEILQHIIDDERIYAYRALRFARGDATELPGFEQDDYVGPSAANQRSLVTLIAEHGITREATISLFEYLPEAALTRAGIASGNPMSVRAIAYHIAGHELHHLNSIREHYLTDA